MTGSPNVSMLWESAEPTESLTKRFGFRSAESAVEWVAGELDRRWSLTASDCDHLVISAWNVMAWLTAGDRRLIAKWSALPQLFPRLRDAASLVAWLDTQDVPVAGPIPAADGRRLIEVGNDAKDRPKSPLPLPDSRFLLGVVPVVEGDLLDVDDSAQVADAGRMLATLHDALAAYPGRFGGGAPNGAEQLVHNDFRSANILHNGMEITAVLDFEEVTYGTRVADLAKATVLLATRYRDWGPANEDVRRVFVAAYQQEASLTSSEQRELDERVSAGLKEMGWE